MKLETKEIADGLHLDKIVWICDYRWKDFDIKQTRNIKPTKALIRPSSESNSTIYYSDCFFSEIKNEKVVKSSLIKLFDNIGFRSYSGVPLNVFTEENECREYYKKQAHEVLKAFEAYKEQKISRLDEISNQICLNI